MVACEDDGTGVTRLSFGGLLKRSPAPLDMIGEMEKAILILKREQKARHAKHKDKNEKGVVDKVDAAVGLIPHGMLKLM